MLLIGTGPYRQAAGWAIAVGLADDVPTDWAIAAGSLGASGQQTPTRHG